MEQHMVLIPAGTSLGKTTDIPFDPVVDENGVLIGYLAPFDKVIAHAEISRIEREEQAMRYRIGQSRIFSYEKRRLSRAEVRAARLAASRASRAARKERMAAVRVGV